MIYKTGIGRLHAQEMPINCHYLELFFALFFILDEQRLELECWNVPIGILLAILWSNLVLFLDFHEFPEMTMKTRRGERYTFCLIHLYFEIS